MIIDARADPELARSYQVVDRRDCSVIKNWLAADEEVGAVLVLRRSFDGDKTETVHFPNGIKITPRPHR